MQKLMQILMLMQMQTAGSRKPTAGSPQLTRCREARALRLPKHLKDQLERAASSIALNLCEGRGKPTLKDQLRFFHIAMGSARECEAVLILGDLKGSAAWIGLDRLGGSLFRLIERAR